VKILDLYCGAGGASMGIHQAYPTAEITGVDIKKRKRYPFPFIQADVLGFTPEFLEGYDFFWASPPCQAFSQSTTAIRANKRKIYNDFIPFTRQLLLGTGKPFIIENVIMAPLLNSVMLCGQMFGLRLLRHRIFEANFPLVAPPHMSHKGLRAGIDGDFITCVKGAEKTGETKVEWQRSMGIDWMTMREMSEAVPPAYSKYLFNQFLEGIWNSS
jgi:DNA (cytosine-5)-methyltransferase 1